MNYHDLLVRSAARDQQAFKVLYHKASPLLFSILLRMLHDRELAEDLLQEAFLKIWENAECYEAGKGSALTWMGTIARNAARDRLRALKVRHYQDECSEPLEALTSAGLEPDEQTDLTYQISSVRESLQQLPEAQRNCVVMAYYEGYSHSEIATKLNKSLGTVKAWIRRGKSQLALTLPVPADV